MTIPRILVVDDEPGILDVCARTLRKHDFEVVTASDAHTARILLQAQAVDLLITDLRMPGESGISLLQTVHETNPGLPLMIITAYPDPPAIDAALNLNVKSFVVKPFNAHEFVSEVKRSLDLQVPEAAPSAAALGDWMLPILEELRQHQVPVLEGLIQRNPRDGRVVLVPGDPNGAVPIDEFLSEYARGERIYLIILPHA
jgi:response regulator RpfG family c-di-GMP phosphodiesterase